MQIGINDLKSRDLTLGHEDLRNPDEDDRFPMQAEICQAYKAYYDTAESIIVSMCKYLEIKVDGKVTTDIAKSAKLNEKYSYHQALLETLKLPSNPLCEIFRQGSVHITLKQARLFRNRWVHREQNGESVLNIYKLRLEHGDMTSKQKELEDVLDAALLCVQREASRRAASEALWETLRSQEIRNDAREQRLLLRERQLDEREQELIKRADALKDRESSLRCGEQHLLLKEQETKTAIQEHKQWSDDEIEVQKRAFIRLEQRENEVRAASEKHKQTSAKKMEDQKKAINELEAGLKKRKKEVKKLRTTVERMSMVRSYLLENSEVETINAKDDLWKVGVDDDDSWETDGTNGDFVLAYEQSVHDFINSWRDTIKFYRSDYHRGIVWLSPYRERLINLPDLPAEMMADTLIQDTKPFVTFLEEVYLLCVNFEAADNDRKIGWKELREMKTKVRKQEGLIEKLRSEKMELSIRCARLWELVNVMSATNVKSRD